MLCHTKFACRKWQAKTNMGPSTLPNNNNHTYPAKPLINTLLRSNRVASNTSWTKSFNRFIHQGGTAFCKTDLVQYHLLQSTNPSKLHWVQFLVLALPTERASARAIGLSSHRQHLCQQPRLVSFHSACSKTECGKTLLQWRRRCLDQKTQHAAGSCCFARPPGNNQRKKAQYSEERPSFLRYTSLGRHRLSAIQAWPSKV